MLRPAYNQVLCRHRPNVEGSCSFATNVLGNGGAQIFSQKAVFSFRVSRAFSTTMISSALILGVARVRHLIRLPFGCAVRAQSLETGPQGFPAGGLDIVFC
ncbi:hypothetical protein MRX96_043472 [Rhipicephalus microplus]